MRINFFKNFEQYLWIKMQSSKRLRGKKICLSLMRLAHLPLLIKIDNIAYSTTKNVFKI